MIKKTILLLTITFFSIFNISGQNSDFLKDLVQKGNVEKASYDQEIPFRYEDGYLFIDIYRNGKKYNFLFDTGAEITVIDKSNIKEFETKDFSETSLSGPVVKNQDVKTLIISDIQIGDINYQNIGAVSINLEFAEEKFCDKIDGIIGSNLMKKSKWQIDFEKETIKISDNIKNLNIRTSKFVFNTKLPAKGFGTETVDIKIGNITLPFNIDTGNGRRKFVANPKYFKKTIRKSDAVEYGFPKSENNYYLIPEKLEIEGVDFSGQKVSLENEVGNLQLMGNKFFEKFLVTIDWSNHKLYLDPVRKINDDSSFDFPIQLTPNFKTNSIEITNGKREFLKKNHIEKDSKVLRINDVKISGLNKFDLCQFWNLQWKEISQNGTIKIVISSGNNKKEITLKKEKITT